MRDFLTKARNCPILCPAKMIRLLQNHLHSKLNSPVQTNQILFRHSIPASSTEELIRHKNLYAKLRSAYAN